MVSPLGEDLSAKVATTPSVVQIVPRLGTRTDGVADYARILAAALDSSDRIPTALLSGDPQDSPGASLKVAERSATALVDALENLATRALLLHYVNYGYSPRGCPFWLIRGLALWKQRNPGVQLVTMFHELFAFGAPWRSSFWLSPVQRYLARKVCGISNAAATNVAVYQRHLRGWQQDTEQRVSLLPVFSNVGEPKAPRSWSERSRQMVVLGREDVATRAYHRRAEVLLQACRALQIEEIIDIGSRARPLPAQLAHIRVSARGFLPPSEVTAILGQARAGFIDYPSDVLGKSTVFAAYAAHGVVPVVSWRRGEEEPGLAEGRNYWSPSAGDHRDYDFESIARGAREWYAGHRLEAQAREFARKLLGNGHQ